MKRWPAASSSQRLNRLLLFAVLLVLMLFSLTLGRYPVPIQEIVEIVLTTGFNESRHYTDKAWGVVEIVRMPRILGVTLCGMGLAMAGLAIVKFPRSQGIPAQRLAATGYGEFHPLDAGGTEEACARNRRIELYHDIGPNLGRAFRQEAREVTAPTLRDPQACPSATAVRPSRTPIAADV